MPEISNRLEDARGGGANRFTCRKRGSTIANIIGRNVAGSVDWVEPDIRLWVFEELVDGRRLSEIINTCHENVKYLPGVKLPENVRAVPDLAEACAGASLLIFVLPHQFLRGALHTIKERGQLRANARAISLIKGLDVDHENDIELASQVISEALNIDCSVMMGANLANEVAQGLFCESTIGATVPENGETFKRLMQTDYFRLNVVPNVAAVELCGALKNIVAVAAGIIDGLLMGDNTKAAIIRIGLEEIRRFSKLFCGQAPDAIFFESCGVADLITSCFGGRNRRVGEAMVTTGKSVDVLEAELLGGQKLQGPPASQSVYQFLMLCGREIEFPLMAAVYRICYEGLPPGELIKSL